MASSFIRAAEAELSCPICFELFVDPYTPKTLPLCGHVCCEVCLKKMVAKKRSRTCPECRKIIKVPVDGVTLFPTNFRLRNLAEKHKNIDNDMLLSGDSITKPGVCICPDHEIQTQLAEGHQLDNLSQEIEDIPKKMESTDTARQVTANALENTLGYENIIKHTLLIHEVAGFKIKEGVNLTPHASANLVPKQHMSDNSYATNVRLVTPGLKRKLKLIQRLDGFHHVCNVTHANNLLAVCEYSDFHPQVIVYHKINGKYEQSLNLNLAPSFYYAKDVAMLLDGRFVLTRGSRIEVHSPQGNFQHNIQTSTMNMHLLCDWDVCCVQATSSGTILSGDYNRSTITELCLTGNIVRTIHTSIKPNHMTLIHDTHIAICNGKTGTVIVMDIASGRETLNIDIPEVTGICYDEYTECLLIVRSKQDKPGMVFPNTGVIEQYSCSTGKLVACLDQGLFNPQGMTMTAGGILAVADQKTVNIYQTQ